jgi:hypothetical protein
MTGLKLLSHATRHGQRGLLREREADAGSGGGGVGLSLALSDSELALILALRSGIAPNVALFTNVNDIERAPKGEKNLRMKDFAYCDCNKAISIHLKAETPIKYLGSDL